MNKKIFEVGKAVPIEEDGEIIYPDHLVLILPQDILVGTEPLRILTSLLSESGHPLLMLHFLGTLEASSQDREVLKTLQKGLYWLRNEISLAEPIDRAEQIERVDQAEKWLAKWTTEELSAQANREW